MGHSSKTIMKNRWVLPVFLLGALFFFAAYSGFSVHAPAVEKTTVMAKKSISPVLLFRDEHMTPVDNATRKESEQDYTAK